jgi:hypothetical protein
VRQQRGVAQRGQLNQAGPVRVPGGRRGGGAQDDAGLADPAGADKRDEARIAQQSVDLAQLRRPPDEFVRLRGELTGASVFSAQGLSARVLSARVLSDSHVTTMVL